MSDPNSVMSKLEQWYRSQCNGDWEHQYGIRIDCIDNPGWSFSVDLDETGLEGRKMAPIFVDNNENDWMHCEIKGTQFVRHGDPMKLGNIIEVFIMFANT